MNQIVEDTIEQFNSDIEKDLNSVDKSIDAAKELENNA